MTAMGKTVYFMGTENYSQCGQNILLTFCHFLISLCPLYNSNKIPAVYEYKLT